MIFFSKILRDLWCVALVFIVRIFTNWNMKRADGFWQLSSAASYESKGIGVSVQTKKIMNIFNYRDIVRVVS